MLSKTEDEVSKYRSLTIAHTQCSTVCLFPTFLSDRVPKSHPKAAQTGSTGMGQKSSWLSLLSSAKQKCLL